MNYFEELLNLIESNGKAISTETFKNDLFLKGSIPVDRATNAIERYAIGVSLDEIYFLMDTTVLGSGKNGMVLTDKAIYFKGSLEKSQNIAYTNIDRFEVVPAENGKDENATLLIHIKGWKTVKLEQSCIYKTALAELLEKIVSLHNHTYDSGHQIEHGSEYVTIPEIVEKNMNESKLIVSEDVTNSQSIDIMQKNEVGFFCSKCGAGIAEGDVFCQKCGVKIGNNEPIKLPPVISEQPMSTKRKWKQWLWFVGSIIIIILLFRSCGESDKYIKTAKQWDIYDYGISYNDVVDKYMTSVKWKERKQSKDLIYIDTSGRLKDSNGNNYKLTFTVEVTPIENSKVHIRVIGIYINGKEQGRDTAVNLLKEFYDAYDGNYATYATYMAEWYNITIFELEDFLDNLWDVFWEGISN